jgi:CP family cyanate transporter-like MFS transporter
VIASIMPFFAGLIRDRFDNLTQAWMLMAAGVVMLIAMATRCFPHKPQVTGCGGA